MTSGGNERGRTGFEDLRLRFACVPDNGRHTLASPSCTSCSIPRQRRPAHEGLLRCYCMRQPGVQDTGDRKINPNECQEEVDMPPRLGSM